MDITVIQTSDAIFYYPLLMETSRSFRAYCIAHGIRYEQFVGVKRGNMPWQAAYNRIFMLKELLDRGITGWVLYADADSVIIDHSFDLRAYLGRYDHLAGIFLGYTSLELPYAVNSGGFAINLSHPVGISLVQRYWNRLFEIPEAAFDAAIFWERDIDEDQFMLASLLDDYVTKWNCGDCFRFERPGESAVNEGPFIHQLLRAAYPRGEDRLVEARRCADQSEGLYRDERAGRSGVYLPASHPRVATACGDKGAVISSRGEAGALLFGPYVPLEEGRWRGLVYGEAHAPLDGRPIRMTADIVCDSGRRTLVKGAAEFPAHRLGTLVEMPFELDQATPDVELRLLIDEAQRVLVYAIQFERV